MRLEGLWIGLLAAQTYYIQVRPEAISLRRQLQQAAIGSDARARLSLVWRGLTRVETFLPAVDGAFSGLQDWFVVHFSGRDSVALLEEIKGHEGVSWVEPAVRRRICGGPSSLAGWHHFALGTETTWSQSQGSPSIVMALIDSGTDWLLPAFHRQVWINPSEDLNGNAVLDAEDLNGVDDDGNGFVDDVIGYDFTDQPFSAGVGDYVGVDPWPIDENGHGTAMASVMVARPDRGPVAGVAPGCRLMILRCFNADGYGEDDDIARALVYAVQNGARIINCSFGDERPSRLIQTVIQYAYRAGVTIVAASGNGTGGRPHFPSGFGEVLAAGGLAYDEVSGRFYLWPLSGYYRVDWVAPADRLPVLYPGGQVRLLSGTSLAAALSCAAAALLLSVHPTLTPDDIRATFCARALPLSTSGWNVYSGSGRIYLPSAMAHPQNAVAGWLFPPEGVPLTSGIPFVFATYHSLLESWEISWASSLEGPWRLLLQGTSPSLRDTLQNWVPSSGRSFLRLTLFLRNGGEVVFLREVSYFPGGVGNAYVEQVVGWREGLLGLIASWKVNVPLYACVEAASHRVCSDKIDTTGSVWLPSSSVGQMGRWVAYTLTDTPYHPLPLPAQVPKVLPYAPWQVNGRRSMEGFYLAEVAPDWDGDGEGDLIVSGRIPATGRVGRLYFLHRVGDTYLPYDSIATIASLLPRDLRDWDGDGVQELLCVWLDSFYVLGGTPPRDLLWRGRGRAARLGANQTVWIREEDGDYRCLTREGSALVSLADTVRWTGSTTIPRLVELRDGFSRIWAFGNYAGWIFLYDSLGQLIRAVFTGLRDVGSYLLTADITGDGRDEIIYLGQGPDGSWWEVGFLASPGWSPSGRVRFWGGSGGGARLFAAGERMVIWLPPHLYVGRFRGLDWEGEAFDAGIWGVFGAWILEGDTVFLLARDTLVRFYRLAPPLGVGPQWAAPGGISPTEAFLSWHAVGPTLSYELYRLQIGEPPALLYTGTDTAYVDRGLTPEKEYYYFVRVVGGAFSPPFFLRPGERPCLDTAWAEGEGTCWVRGTSRWEGEGGTFFRLRSGGQQPLFSVASGSTWLLLFPTLPHEDTLEIDTTLTDVRGRYLSSACTLLRVGKDTSSDTCVSPTAWRLSGEREVVLTFAGTLPPEAYDLARYAVTPVGEVERVEPFEGGLRLVLSVSPAVWPIEIRWDWGERGCPYRVAFSPEEAAQATWGFFPNPVRGHRQVYFWGLPPETEVKILTPEGKLCRRLIMPRSEGPLAWDLRTVSGEYLSPGVYLIWAEKEGWRAVEKLFIEER
ncbi:MAG: S8 family serine peptidase [Bacteroidia bacterium]|nr:S8 family serine peptidase [Bacteroidia bacterium]